MAESTPAVGTSEWMMQEVDAGRATFTDLGEFRPLGLTSWTAVDLGPVLRDEKRVLEPQFLKRKDGRALLYPGAPHIFYGESETLKSWAAFLACKSFLDEGQTALYIDFESNDVCFVERARLVGIADGSIGDSLRYMRPEEPLITTDRSGMITDNEQAMLELKTAMADLGPGLVVLDGVSECYALHGWDINKATDAALFQRVFGRWPGVASIAIDHAGKDAERGQIGSQHKRAGLDGAQYEFKAVRREGRGGHSTASIRVKKDRYGSVRSFAPDERIGTIHVADSVWIDPPAEREAPDAEQRERVLTYVRLYPGHSSTQVIKGANLRKSDGLSLLKQMETEELLRCEKKGRGTDWFPAKRAETASAA